MRIKPKSMLRRSHRNQISMLRSFLSHEVTIETLRKGLGKRTSIVYVTLLYVSGEFWSKKRLLREYMELLEKCFSPAWNERNKRWYLMKKVSNLVL